MPVIQIDCFYPTNHDNYNALPAANSVISAGNVINSSGTVVAGVAISCAAAPFGIAINSGVETPAFAEVNDLAEQRQFIHETRVPPAAMVVSGLPAGTYTVTAFGWRNVAENRIGELVLNGRTPVTYNSGNLNMTYAAHTAVDTVTITAGQDLNIQIRPAVGSGSAHLNAVFVSWPDAPAVISVDGDDVISQGQQNIEIIVNNIPSGNVPVRAGAGGTNGVGGTDFTGFSAVEGGTAGSFTITADVPIGIATSSSVQCYVEYEPE